MFLQQLVDLIPKTFGSPPQMNLQNLADIHSGRHAQWIRITSYNVCYTKLLRHNLSKFVRSNQNTCFNQRAIVRKGQEVKAGEIIADGPATHFGELALGKNITVAFMPWGGYNFEDSILVGERLHRDGVYTSVHIEEFEVLARDTKLGKEDRNNFV